MCYFSSGIAGKEIEERNKLLAQDRPLPNALRIAFTERHGVGVMLNKKIIPTVKHILLFDSRLMTFILEGGTPLAIIAGTPRKRSFPHRSRSSSGALFPRSTGVYPRRQSELSVWTPTQKSFTSHPWQPPLIFFRKHVIRLADFTWSGRRNPLHATLGELCQKACFRRMCPVFRISHAKNAKTSYTQPLANSARRLAPKECVKLFEFRMSRAQEPLASRLWQILPKGLLQK